jgi:hypothetical protein
MIKAKNTSAIKANWGLECTRATSVVRKLQMRCCTRTINCSWT